MKTLIEDIRLILGVAGNKEGPIVTNVGTPHGDCLCPAHFFALPFAKVLCLVKTEDRQAFYVNADVQT